MRHLIHTAVFCSSLFCSAVGLAQTCPTGIEQTKPNSQYTVNSDNTVSDSKTGLIWMRCSLGQDIDSANCTGMAATYHWQAALAAAQQANSDAVLGYTDWRLPSIAELRTLVEKACYSPAINTFAFSGAVSFAYWASSPLAYSNSHAWGIAFQSGIEAEVDKISSYSVRLVRGGL